jgi:hypothetical protein
MAAKGTLSAELKVLRRNLAAATPAPAVAVAAAGSAAGDAKAGGA